MILYRKSLYKCHDDVIQQLKIANGITRNRIPHGLSAVAFFDFGNIYIDECLNEILDDKVSGIIDDCLRRMSKDDYGNISPEEAEANIDNKYFGDGKEITGQYKTSLGTVNIKIFEACTAIWLNAP